MKGSVKLFIASLIVLAASIGFFAGSLCFKQCPKAPMVKEGMMPPPPPGFNGQLPPGFEGKGPHGPKGPHAMKGHGPKGPNPEMMDSLLQITPEQKAALEKNRAEQDSVNKELRKSKFEAEKSLGVALDSENAEAIEAAKAKVMEAQKALLDHRVNAMAALNKILTKQQREKFRQFHKDRKGPRGPMPKQEF